jgi:hypothetical protein
MWAAKQENFQPAERCFFLTSPFIELLGTLPLLLEIEKAFAKIEQ